MKIIVSYNSHGGELVMIQHQADNMDDLGRAMVTLPMIATEDADFDGPEENQEENREWN